LKGETFLYSESNLLARDEVHCEFARNDSEFRLRSDSLAINRTNRGTDTLTSGSLVARGNVDVESLSEARIHGQGDELEVDKFGRGELIAFEGRRIHAEGETPGGRFPFDMTARRLQFSNAFLDASQPEIQLELQSGEDSDEPGIPLRASAERLEAQGDTLSLTGGVHLEGLSQGISPWTLRAESSRISLREARNHKRLDSLEASGDVEFDLQGVLHADGDEFLVKMGQQRLRVAGDPVRVVYRGLDIESSWVEYDLLIHGLSTARDSVFTPATSDEGRNQEP
jgi:hypothetical protein